MFVVFGVIDFVFIVSSIICITEWDKISRYFLINIYMIPYGNTIFHGTYFFKNSISSILLVTDTFV